MPPWSTRSSRASAGTPVPAEREPEWIECGLWRDVASAPTPACGSGQAESPHWDPF